MTVLVADDNDVARRLCRRVLEKAGYTGSRARTCCRLTASGLIALVARLTADRRPVPPPAKAGATLAPGTAHKVDLLDGSKVLGNQASRSPGRSRGRCQERRGLRRQPVQMLLIIGSYRLRGTDSTYDGHVICPCCGMDVTSVKREIKMELPDAVLAIPTEDRQTRVVVGGTAFMYLDGRRFFVRALLPVVLSDGHEFHFGVWLETPKETSRELWTNWEKPQYSNMRFEATLANAVPPWNGDVLGSRCVAAVRDKDQLPYIESSTDPRLSILLQTPWSRAECEALLDKVWGRQDQ